MYVYWHGMGSVHYSYYDVDLSLPVSLYFYWVGFRGRVLFRTTYAYRRKSNLGRLLLSPSLWYRVYGLDSSCGLNHQEQEPSN